MAVGDVNVQLVENVTTTSLAAVITAMRVTANDEWLMTSINNGQDVLVVNIEEAA